MIVAEQYFSFESFTAFSTWRGSRPATGDAKRQPDAGEHLRLDGRAIRFGLDDAVGHRLARLLQDPHHVERAARRSAGQQELHRPGAEVAATGLRRAVDDDRVPAAGFGDEAHAVDPFDPCFHGSDRVHRQRRRTLGSGTVARPPANVRTTRCMLQCNMRSLNRPRSRGPSFPSRGHIPPFSSYGGILRRGSKPRLFFAGSALRHCNSGDR